MPKPGLAQWQSACGKNSTESPVWRIPSEDEYSDYSQSSGSTIPIYEMSNARITSQKNMLQYTDECRVSCTFRLKIITHKLIAFREARKSG